MASFSHSHKSADSQFTSPEPSVKRERSGSVETFKSMGDAGDVGGSLPTSRSENEPGPKRWKRGDGSMQMSCNSYHKSTVGESFLSKRTEPYKSPYASQGGTGIESEVGPPSSVLKSLSLHPSSTSAPTMHHNADQYKGNGKGRERISPPRVKRRQPGEIDHGSVKVESDEHKPSVKPDTEPSDKEDGVSGIELYDVPKFEPGDGDQDPTLGTLREGGSAGQYSSVASGAEKLARGKGVGYVYQSVRAEPIISKDGKSWYRVAYLRQSSAEPPILARFDGLLLKDMRETVEILKVFADNGEHTRLREMPAGVNGKGDLLIVWVHVHDMLTRSVRFIYSKDISPHLPATIAMLVKIIASGSAGSRPSTDKLDRVTWEYSHMI